MAQQTITVDFNANLARFTSSIDKATQDLNKFQSNAARVGNQIKAAFSNVTLGLGAGLSVGAFAGMISESIRAADALTDLRDRTGLTIETLNGLQWAAKLGDTNMEALTTSVGRLNKAVGEARGGNEAMAEALARLGVTANTPEEALIQIADAVASMDDPFMVAAELSKVLGRSFQELMPLLINGGAGLRAWIEEGQKLSPVTEAMAESAAEFTDNMDRLALSSKAALLPLTKLLTDAANAAFEAAEDFRGLDAALAALGTFGVVGETLAVSAANVGFVFKVMANDVVSAMTAVGYAMTLDFGMARKTLDQAAAFAIAEREKLDKLEQRILRPEATLRDIGGNQFAGTDLDFIREQERAIAQLTKGTREFKAGALSESDAEKIQKNFEKAFDTQPLDDYLKKLRNTRKGIEDEYAKLKANAEAGEIGAESIDVTVELQRGREAFARGDTKGAEAFVERAKASLTAYTEGEGDRFVAGYLTDQLKEFELAMVDTAIKTGEAARTAAEENLKVAQEVFEENKLTLKIDFDHLGQSIKDYFVSLSEQLVLNPTVNPVVASSTANDIRDAAMKRGAR